MSLIVQKFGGTSVANTERLKNVADIVTKTAQAGNQVVVVVSAQGDTTDDLIVKAAELNDRPSKREMDVLLNTGEMISMSLLAMAIQKLGFPVVSPDRLADRSGDQQQLLGCPHQAHRRRAPQGRAG